MFIELVSKTRVLEIVGDMIRVEASGAALGDLAVVDNVDGSSSTARVVGIDRNVVSLQVFVGGMGLSTHARVRFLGHPLQVKFSKNILGRVFRGSGEPIDGKPELSGDPEIPVGACPAGNVSSEYGRTETETGIVGDLESLLLIGYRDH